jgi:lipopolysaccharide transport system ATP-binding protein
MSEVVISAENIGKKYRISHRTNEKYHTFREEITKRVKSLGKFNKGENNKNTEEDFWALSDISFEIKKGDVCGIIGRNGAGKSTLLKIISRIVEPTKGRLEIEGRVASLLEVGTGFHQELTGRENIFLNGSILGMSSLEIKKKFDAIVDFSGVSQFLDTPVKRYSSGMYVRLAFAVAANLEPEILVVDEVLAVGDSEFQQKCLGKMNEISKEEGRTILFVSHNIGAVQSLCSTGMLLNKGKLEFYGSINDAINKYNSGLEQLNKWSGINGDPAILTLNSTYIRTFYDDSIFYSQDVLELGIHFCAHIDFKDLVIGFNIFSSIGSPLVRVLYNDYNNQVVLEKGNYHVKFHIPANTLAPGNYRLSFDFAIPHVKKLNSNESDLIFEVNGNLDGSGNRYFVQGNSEYNSLIRPNWFHSITKENYRHNE